MNVWIDVAIVSMMFAVGSILFGHFEERTPKWRRVLKLFAITGAAALVSSTAGRIWTAALLGGIVGAAAVVHAWWLPKHGINPWTGEPKDKYYALRGWKV
jgi:biotin transporter BioY